MFSKHVLREMDFASFLEVGGVAGCGRDVQGGRVGRWWRRRRAEKAKDTRRRREDQENRARDETSERHRKGMGLEKPRATSSAETCARGEAGTG